MFSSSPQAVQHKIHVRRHKCVQVELISLTEDQSPDRGEDPGSDHNLRKVPDFAFPELAGCLALREHLAHSRYARTDDLAMEDVCKLGELPTLCNQQAENSARLFVIHDVGILARQQLAEKLLRGAGKRRNERGKLFEHGVNHAANYGPEESFLILEIEVDRSFGNSSALRNVLDASG